MVKATIYLRTGEAFGVKNYKCLKDYDGCIMYFYDQDETLQLAVHKDMFSHMILENTKK